MGQFIHIIIGGFLIGLGFLVKAYPMLIAGYNTMPEEQRKNVDVDGLSSMMRNHMTGMGLLLIIGTYVFSWLGWKSISGSWPVISILSVIPFMAIQAQKYDHNRKSSTKLLVIFTVVLVISFGTFGFIYFSSQPPEISITENQISISGLYGTTASIKNLELNNALGKIEIKTNGFQIGDVYKGHFRVQGRGECLLFLQSTEGPFILVYGNGGETIVVNQTSPQATRNLFDFIRKNK